VLELGASHVCSSNGGKCSDAGGGGSVEQGASAQQGLVWTTVRQESETVVVDLNRRRPGCATLVRVNGTWPLADRRSANDAGAVGPSQILSVMMDTTKALRAIDASLSRKRQTGNPVLSSS
jgi:hypothetical protein